MKQITLTTDDYATLVDAFRNTTRMGKKDTRDGLVTHTIDHPEYGASVVVMDMKTDHGWLIVRNFDEGHG